MTDPMRPPLFWSFGASILLHLIGFVLIWKVHVPAPGPRDFTPLMVRVMQPGEIPRFIDQPDAAKATKPVRSKDISQVTSEARGHGSIQGPGTTPERPKTRKGGETPTPERPNTRKGGEAPAIPKTEEARAIPQAEKPVEENLPSLREQIASLGELGLSGGEAVHGEPGADERTISLETQSSEYAPYLAEVKRRIVRWWDYPPYARQVGLGGKVVVVFSIIRDGNLVGVQVTKSSGVSALDDAAVKAIRAGAPYSRFSPDFTFRQLNIVASFHYSTRAIPSR